MTKNSYMRKTIGSALYKVIGSLAGVVLAGMISSTALADTPGTVTGDRVNVRSEANTTSTVLTKVTANESVTIVDETTGSDGNKWYKIKTSGGTTGFVRADYVKSGGGNTTTTTTTTTTTPATNDTPNVTTVTDKTAYIKGEDGTVNIRKGPSTTADLVASAQAKSEITITGETTATDGYKWYQIKFTANGQSMTGFVRSDLITYEAPANNTTPATTTVEGGTGTPENPDGTGEGGEGTGEGGEGTGEGGEGGEGTSETTTEPASSQTASTASLQFLEPVGEPANVPAGYEKVDVMMGDQVYSAWAKGDYYIVYGISGNSDAQWYVYDYKNNSFVSYDGLFGDADAKTKKGTSSNLLIPLIIAGALAAIFLITTIFFAIKAFSGRDEYDDNYDIGYDDDDEDDGEDYEEFDDDDYEEKPAKTKRVIVPKKAEPKAKREEYYDDEEDEEYYDGEEDDYEDEDEYEKPSKASKKKAKKEKKSFKNKILDYFTVQEDDDDDDDEDYEDEDEYDEDDYDDNSTGDMNFIDL